MSPQGLESTAAVSEPMLKPHDLQLFMNISSFTGQNIREHHRSLILFSKDWGLGSRRPGLMPMQGEGIFTQVGRPWKHSRELLCRQFVRIHRQNSRIFDKHVEKLISKLRSEKGVVDLQPHLFHFTLATTTALVFGEPGFALLRAETDTFEKTLNYASYISAVRLPLADLEWTWKPAKFGAACATMKEYASHFVQFALDDMEMNGEEAASERHAFILELYEDMLDPVRVRDQLVHVLIARRDMMACLMSRVFFLLRFSRNFAMRSNLSPVGSHELNRAKIGKMNYLRRVINESEYHYNIPELRLPPDIPSVPPGEEKQALTTVVMSAEGCKVLLE
ncbi:Cytochrome P450 E-class CYP52 [Penicillium cf. griseofulvum]|nr:Cytochrome P450 E-class CYP52 [Penicillium cf. griseofulvum]